MSKLDLAFMMKKEGHFIPEVQKRIDLYVDKLNAELEQANKFLETANNSSIAMQNKCVELKRELDTAQESTRFYRNEWESACERIRFREQDIYELKHELETATAEVERLKQHKSVMGEREVNQVRAIIMNSSTLEANERKEIERLTDKILSYYRFDKTLIEQLQRGHSLITAELTKLAQDMRDALKGTPKYQNTMLLAEADKILGVKNE